MVKFLIVIGILFIILLTIVIRIKKKLNAFLQNFVPTKNQQQDKEYSNEEVLYQKDEIVVLKGEAKKKN